MPRKRKSTAAENTSSSESTQTAVAEAPAPAQQHGSHPVTDVAKAAPVAESPTAADTYKPAPSKTSEPKAAADDKGWSKPYVALLVCREQGFEMGENRRFKQRVFLFKDKPTEEIRNTLKEHGFVYRPLEKAWTVAATHANRIVSDRIAKELAGKAEGIQQG
jgi:hypothetical protein